VIKGSVGTGFRAPSLNELYYPGYGNPALRPENTVGYDIGLRHDLSRSMASVEIAYFDNSYRNMIASNPVTWLADNIGRARSYGMELQASFRPSGAITLQGSYAYTRTEDASTGKQLLRRPRNSGACSVAYHGGSYELVASGVFVGRRLDNDFGGPFGEYMSSPYSTYDLALTYRIGGSRELFCKLANVSDERYEEIAGYPASGFGVMAGTKMEF
jgi:vitamin B12 transporter